MNSLNNLTALGRSLSSYSLQSPDKIKHLKSRLQVGQLVKGRVIDILPGGKYLFRLQGLNLIAKSAVMLKMGAAIYAFVSEIHPKLVLKWAHGKNENARLKKGLKKLGISLNRLNILIADTILESDLPVSLESLNTAIGMVSDELKENESKESIKKALSQIIDETHAEQTKGSVIEENKEINSALRIKNNLKIFSGALSLADLQEDANLKAITRFISDWNSISNVRNLEDIPKLLPQIGFRHEAILYHDIRNGKLTPAEQDRTIKSAMIGFKVRLNSLLKMGYKVTLLNKLLSSADNIIKELDALVLNDLKGLSILGIFPPVDRYDGGTLLWKSPRVAEDDDNWSLKIELNFEPLGYAEVDIIMNSRSVKLELNLNEMQSSDLVSENIEILKEKLEKLNLKVEKINVVG